MSLLTFIDMRKSFWTCNLLTCQKVHSSLNKSISSYLTSSHPSCQIHCASLIIHELREPIQKHCLSSFDETRWQESCEIARAICRIPQQFSLQQTLVNRFGSSNLFLKAGPHFSGSSSVMSHQSSIASWKAKNLVFPSYEGATFLVICWAMQFAGCWGPLLIVNASYSFHELPPSMSKSSS